MSEPKQVIVMRKDLNMRKGKMIAQGSHASMAFLTRRIGRPEDGGSGDWCPFTTLESFSEAELEWLRGRFTKICVYVNSEEELLAIHNQAIEAGLVSHLITDAGLTEFGGVPTNTCCAIGPGFPEKLDPITGNLPLL